MHEKFERWCHGHLFELLEQACSLAHLAETILIFIVFFVVEQVVIEDTANCFVYGNLFDNGGSILVELGPPVVSIDAVFKSCVAQEEVIEELFPGQAALFGACCIFNLIIQLALAADVKRIDELRVL